MSAQSISYISPEQYLEIERKAECKSEYVSGQMFGMAGGSLEHSAIGTNLAGELRSSLRGKPCQVFNSDLRVTVMQTGLKTYPDVTVVCGEPNRHPLDKDSIINPTVLLEVLSDSTEAYDRGGKWAHYQRLDSLQEYVLVSQNEARVERYVRQSDGQWLYSRTDGVESDIPLDSLGCRLPLAEIYARVTFPLAAVGIHTSGEHIT